MKIRNFLLAAAMAATAGAVPLAASAQALPWPLNAVLPGWANGNYQYGANVPTGGVIASVNGSSFTLQNGTTVFMHQGTVINPTGTSLQPGMSVSILGTPNGGGRFNANEVDVSGYANGYGNSGRPYAYGQPYGYAQPYGYGQPYYAPGYAQPYNGPNYRYPEDRAARDRAARERWQAQHAQQYRNNAAQRRSWENNQRHDRDEHGGG
jgi:hypothetical protein